MKELLPYSAIPPLANLKRRSLMLRALREFFHAHDFMEVETAVRVLAPAPECHVEAMAAGAAWLRTSPELLMKRLLAAGAERIYQIGPCFRGAECGCKHNQEFTMLEWYRMPGDNEAILRDCRALLPAVALAVTGSATLCYQGATIALDGPWEEIEVRDAYRCWAGWDPVKNWDELRFDHDMLEIIEPALPRDRPCLLRGYPAPVAALAKLRESEEEVADRWELYIGGLEMANAYSELVDGTAQRQRFVADRARRKRLGRADFPLDEEFLQDLERAALPPCGGIALGVDRLAMLCCDVTTIAEARPFCQPPGGAW